MSMKLHLATGNAHKVKELARLFAEAGLEVEVASAKEVGGMPEVDENAETFEGNALLKAEALGKQVPDGWVLADDSGLEVDALEGAPGIFSARYAGPGATDEDNRKKLLVNLTNIPEARRGGRFVCALVLLGPGRQEFFRGECVGTLIEEERGEGGFGYDPIFRPEGKQKTFGEMTAEQKNQLSHRARAMAKLVNWIRANPL